MSAATGKWLREVWRPRRIFTQTGSSKCSKCYSTDAHTGRLKVSTLYCCLICFVFATVMQYRGTKQVFKSLKTLFWNDKDLIVLQSLSPGLLLLVQSTASNLSLKIFPFWMNLTIESNQWILPMKHLNANRGFRLWRKSDAVDSLLLVLVMIYKSNSQNCTGSPSVNLPYHRYMDLDEGPRS